MLLQNFGKQGRADLLSYRIMMQNLTCKNYQLKKQNFHLLQRSSSSPPQPQNLFENPFTSSKCSREKAPAPPKIVEYGNLKEEQFKELFSKCSAKFTRIQGNCVYHCQKYHQINMYTPIDLDKCCLLRFMKTIQVFLRLLIITTYR